MLSEPAPAAAPVTNNPISPGMRKKSVPVSANVKTKATTYSQGPVNLSIKRTTVPVPVAANTVDSVTHARQ